MCLLMCHQNTCWFYFVLSFLLRLSNTLLVTRINNSMFRKKRWCVGGRGPCGMWGQCRWETQSPDTWRDLLGPSVSVGLCWDHSPVSQGSWSSQGTSSVCHQIKPHCMGAIRLPHCSLCWNSGENKHCDKNNVSTSRTWKLHRSDARWTNVER